MRQVGWEHFEHGADIGVRGLGRTPEEAFEQAAMAMVAVVADPESIKPREAVSIACRDADLELLFVDWLNALVYEMATRHMLFCRFTVELCAEGGLRAQALGEPVDPARHRPVVEIKGATYTELAVREQASGGWIAQCVVDV